MILLLLETVCAVFDNICASAHSTVIGFLDHTAYLTITYFSSTTEIPTLGGKIETTFEIKRNENVIHIQRQGSSKAWNVSLMGIETTDGITTIKVDATKGELRVQLK